MSPRAAHVVVCTSVLVGIAIAIVIERRKRRLVESASPADQLADHDAVKLEVQPLEAAASEEAAASKCDFGTEEPVTVRVAHRASEEACEQIIDAISRAEKEAAEATAFKERAARRLEQFRMQVEASPPVSPERCPSQSSQTKEPTSGLNLILRSLTTLLEPKTEPKPKRGMRRASRSFNDISRAMDWRDSTKEPPSESVWEYDTTSGGFLRRTPLRNDSFRRRKRKASTTEGVEALRARLAHLMADKEAMADENRKLHEAIRAARLTHAVRKYLSAVVSRRPLPPAPSSCLMHSPLLGTFALTFALRISQAGGGGSEGQNEEQEALKQYTAARDALVAMLQKNREAAGQRQAHHVNHHVKGASLGEMYESRDRHMHRLGDTDLQGEYGWYTALYLSASTSTALRGMAEMALIKIGELVRR